MKLGFILAGFIFFANPNIGIIDIFPDFIGIFLIIKGLSKTSLIVEWHEKAQNAFWKLAFIEILKTAANFILLLNINTMPLLLSFTFSIVELIVFIPAVNELFEGFFYAGMRFGGDAVFDSKQKIKNFRDPSNGERVRREVTVERGVRIKIITIVFLILRDILAVIPNTTELQLFKNQGEVAPNVIRLADFNNLFITVECAVGVVLGVVWLSLFIPYFTKVVKDRKMTDVLEKAFNEKLKLDPFLPITVKMKYVSACLIGAFIAYNSLYSNYVNYLPNCLSAIFLIIAAVLLKSRIKSALWAIPFAAVSGIISLINLALQRKYFVTFQYLPDDSFWRSNAGILYSRIQMFSVAENAAVLIAFIILFFSLPNCLKKDTHNVSDDLIEREALSKIRRKFICIVLFTAAVCIIWVLHPWILLYIDPMITTFFVILTVLWSIFSSVSLLDIYDSIYKTNR